MSKKKAVNVLIQGVVSYSPHDVTNSLKYTASSKVCLLKWAEGIDASSPFIPASTSVHK
jgi:hypothetical protein